MAVSFAADHFISGVQSRSTPVDLLAWAAHA
jgi:hypothetical protein